VLTIFLKAHFMAILWHSKHRRESNQYVNTGFALLMPAGAQRRPSGKIADVIRIADGLGLTPVIFPLKFPPPNHLIERPGIPPPIELYSRSTVQLLSSFYG